MILSSLEKCIVLIPVNYNDGSPVPDEVIAGILETFFVEFGGSTVAGTVKGTFRMKDGKKQVDDNLEVWVAIEKGEVGESHLRRICSDIAMTLEQESIYFERTGSTVEFVPPGLNK